MTQPRSSRALWTPPLDFATFRAQETLQILLNLAVMAGLMLLHAVFQPVIGNLTGVVALAFVLRFAMQMGELAFLNRTGASLGARATWWYARLSVAINIAFAAVVSHGGVGQESHYSVLMVIPVLAATFRFSSVGLVAVVLSVIALTVNQFWMAQAGAGKAAALTETFEATTVSLIFIVVAAVVRLLAVQLWRHEAELRESRDRLVREEKLAAVGRVASAIAHEVRNPVSMITSAVATARRPETSAEVRAEVFDILGQEARRLERLTQDFLAYARQRPPQPRGSSTAEALGLAAGLVRGKAEELGVSLESACENAPVVIDPFQIQQALLNLALNALDATPRGGKVRLSAQQQPGGVVFAVENSGSPISAEVAARLGEPFFSTKPHGTGLGLAIARSIAQGHGGDLVLAANEPGRVRFELRIREAA